MTTHTALPSCSLCCLLLSATFVGNCQTISLPTKPVQGYINPAHLGSEVRDYLRAYGNRLMTPGKERTTLVGTYSNGTSTVPATITFQMPNLTRVDLGGTSPKTLILNGSQTSVAAAGLDQDLLETLTDDTAESFLFGLANGVHTQFLGGRFRNDDGRTTPYTGPLRDIYRRQAAAAAVTGAPVRTKLYLFDSRTKFFAGCQYTITRNGTPVTVQIVHGAWTTIGANAFPVSITRIENGSQVFSISIQQAATAAKSIDATFTLP
jgi:outer membrane lipoprotein-sorting protein